MKRVAPDWLLYGLMTLLMGIGIANLYSIESFPPWNWKYAYARQLVWAGIAVGIATFTTLTEAYIWRYFTYAIYAGGAAVMLLTALIGREIHGARAWLEIGPIRFQPSEFMKIATALAVAAYLNRYEFRWERWIDRMALAGLISLPVGLTLLQQDTGTALTYAALLVPLYRGGLAVWIILLPLLLGGIAFLVLLYDWILIGIVGTVVILTSYFFIFRRQHLWIHLGTTAFLWIWLGTSKFLHDKILAPHQRQRIQVLLDPYKDPLGAGWNTIQARVAIVAGGLMGRGYGKGLQSKLDFIPQRHTDFAFCGIAEEWGWVGSTSVLMVYLFFLLRLTYVAEKSNAYFAVLFGYGLAGFLWIHLLINLAMILGLFPIVGIPLALISYGGSSWVAIGWGVGILQSFYRERRMRLFG
ncbi:MAG: FtsW/RodA/SpoVE family cell cycle protein [Bacteroidia bacterium]|nr:rod shape-determining protein RodA [Bacteroidia bacterium]MDW8015171.1 FtsW/RodA/SpoVE family cell cycle protein [Bacteroidia bacterium]